MRSDAVRSDAVPPAVPGGAWVEVPVYRPPRSRLPGRAAGVPVSALLGLLLGLLVGLVAGVLVVVLR